MWETSVARLRPLIPYLVILAIWAIASGSGVVSSFLIPSPARVATTAWKMLLDGSLLRNAVVSFGRVAIGFIVSAGVAIPLAAAIASNRTIRDIVRPPLEFLRHIPPLALVPLLILWLGIGEPSKIAVIVLSTFFPVFLGTLSGIAQCDPKLIEVGKICGLSDRETMRRIVLPAALPTIVAGLRLGLGYSWRALIGAELVAAAAGLGYLIINAETLARTDIIFVGILTIGVLGLWLDAIACAIARRLMPWQPLEADLASA